jgi:6-phosphogluconolactonase (cycloisomerase 2 family)
LNWHRISPLPIKDMKVSCSGCSHRYLALLFFTIIAAGLCACSGGGSAPPPPARTLQSIGVTPANPSVTSGLTEQFTATGTYSDGTSANLTSSVTWASATGSVATIDSSGLVTAESAGTSVISATSGKVSGSTTLTVNPPALVSIAITPSTAQLGSTTQLTATGTYADQSTQDLTDTVTWTAVNSYIGTISTSGVFSPLRAGYTAVTATDGSVQASGAITVLASPRYLLISNSDNRNLSRAAIDAGTGQPHYLGYFPTNISNSVGSPCLTLDPAGMHAYLTTQSLASGGSGYAGAVSAYSVDPSSGSISTVFGSPTSVSIAPGCLQFAPSGNFAYAISEIDNSGNQLGIFSVNSDSTLSLTNTVTLPDNPTGLAVDPLGQYLYVATLASPFDTGSNASLYGYSLDATTGALTPLTGSPWSLPPGTWGELSVSPSGNNLFVSDLNGTAIIEYTLNRSSGSPTQAESFDSTCINPSGLEFSPDGGHAYATCGESAGRSVENAPLVDYSVGSNGQLSVENTAFAGPSAGQIQVDPSGEFVYVLGTGNNYSSSGSGSYTVAGNVLLEYEVQSDGSIQLIQQVAGQINDSMVLLSGPAPLAWTTTAAYITTSGDDKVTPYAVQLDGTLTPGTSLATAAAPFSASMLPWGSDLLFATQSSPPNLFGYAIAGTSILTGSDLGPAASAGGIVISPSGQWAYATDPASGLVDVLYSASPGNWGLTYTSPGGPLNTFSAESGAGPITMDPAGRYMAVANQTSASLSLIDSQGAAPVPPILLSFTPLTITADATGNFFFTAGDDGELHMFLSNGLGSLTDVAQGTLLGTTTVSVAADPSGRFIYAAGPAGLNAFAVDITADTLSPISLNIPVSLSNATGVFVDPSGKFLYAAVSNGSTNALYLFTINSDGTLTAASTNPVAAPNHVTSMVFQTSVQ